MLWLDNLFAYCGCNVSDQEKMSLFLRNLIILKKEPSESQELRIENLRLQVSLKQVQLMKLAGDLIPLE